MLYGAPFGAPGERMFHKFIVQEDFKPLLYNVWKHWGHARLHLPMEKPRPMDAWRGSLKKEESKAQ